MILLNVKFIIGEETLYLERNDQQTGASETSPQQYQKRRARVQEYSREKKRWCTPIQSHGSTKEKLKQHVYLPKMH